MKPEYQRKWAVISAEWNATSAEDRLKGNLKAPHPVAVRAKVTKEFMSGESEDFMAELKIRNEDDYLSRMKTWQDGKTEPTTPQQYHQ